MAWAASIARAIGRDVALKVVPETVGHDAERVARFRREAQVLPLLNYPNIAAIYAIEALEGSTIALAMDLVEGPTLEDLIHTGEHAQALPVADALPIARQIADALDSAHERGIVHAGPTRDRLWLGLHRATGRRDRASRDRSGP